MANVLLVVRWPVGGIRTFIRYVYADWDYFSLSLTLITPDLPELDALQKDLEALDVTWIRLGKAPGVRDFKQAIQQALKSQSYDLVHAHGYTSAIATSLGCFFRRTPTVFTSHDLLLPSQFKGVKGALKRLALGLSLKRFDVIHSVSEDAQSNLLSMLRNVPSEKCYVVRNGIETEQFLNAVPVNIRKLLGAGADTLILGYFGRFMAQKGFRYLVDAIEELAYKDLRVVCFGEGGFIREERARLESKGLAEYFVFLPFVPNVAPYMKGCDMVVMPSVWEACGLLAMEALVAGVPLVATTCPGLREVCRDSPAVMAEPQNAESLAQAIIKCSLVPRETFTAFQNEAASRYDIRETRKGIYRFYDSYCKDVTDYGACSEEVGADRI